MPTTTPNLETVIRSNTRAYAVNLVTRARPDYVTRQYPREGAGGIGCTAVIVLESHHPDRVTVQFFQHPPSGPCFENGTYRTTHERARELLALSSAESARRFILANQR